MDNSLFLKKYRRSSELVGKEGPIGILNNLRTNITGFKPTRIKKMKQQKKPEYELDYNYISSVVKEDFNKNKHFIPQLNVLLNPMKYKNNQIYAYNCIKSKDNNYYNEENNKLVYNNSEINNNKVNKERIVNNSKKINNDNKNIKQKNLKNLLNYNQNKKVLLNTNHDSKNNNNNSKQLLPLIVSHSQKMIPSSKFIYKNYKSKKSNTPILNRQPGEISTNNKSSIINFENGEILKKSKSTMNINSESKNIFSYRNNNKKKENYTYKNLSNIDYDNIKKNNSSGYIPVINENKKYVTSQILLNNKYKKMKTNKKIINDNLNNINDVNKLEPYIYDYNTETNYLNYQKENQLNRENNYLNRNKGNINFRSNNFNYNQNEEIMGNNYSYKDNNLYVINEEEESNKMENNTKTNNNDKDENLIEILMKQRKQYFNNIENNIRYQNAMGH